MTPPFPTPSPPFSTPSVSVTASCLGFSNFAITLAIGSCVSGVVVSSQVLAKDCSASFFCFLASCFSINSCFTCICCNCLNYLAGELAVPPSLSLTQSRHSAKSGTLETVPLCPTSCLNSTRTQLTFR